MFLLWRGSSPPVAGGRRVLQRRGAHLFFCVLVPMSIVQFSLSLSVSSNGL